MKLCECGCGKPAPIAAQSNKKYGHVKGEPVRVASRAHGRWPREEETDGEGE